MRPRLIPAILVAAIVLIAASLVLGTLRRPEPPVWAPTPVQPREVGAVLAGPERTTLDAGVGDRWRYFDFSRGSAVEAPGPLEWDLAFRRNEIAVNGGEGMAGRGGAMVVEGVPFDSLRAAPAEGYLGAPAARDSTSAAFDDWYDYSLTSHLLVPRPRTYAIRTADGRYAKLEILGYYCPGARSGCPTFRWVYQGDGSRSLAPESEPERRSSL